MPAIAQARQVGRTTLRAEPGRPPGPPGSAVRIRDYEPADKAAVLEVLQAAFGTWPHGIEGVDPSEFFRWKLESCPFGDQVSLVAEADGVVGFVAQLPWPFRLRGRSVGSLRGMDFSVHPAHRRRGISTMIMRAAIDGTPGDAAIAWNNPNDQSRPGLLKTGRRDVVVLPRFLAPHGAPGRTIRRALARGSRTPADLCIEAETAGSVLLDGSFVAAVLGGGDEPHGRLATAAGLDYLRWRYGQFDIYRAFRSDPGIDAPGIVIFRQRRHGALWVSQVCELLVAGDDVHCARHLLGKVRGAAPADLLTATFNSRLRAARLGFVRAGGGSLLTIRRLRPDLPDLARRQSWGLSLGDLELL